MSSGCRPYLSWFWQTLKVWKPLLPRVWSSSVSEVPGSQKGWDFTEETQLSCAGLGEILLLILGGPAWQNPSKESWVLLCSRRASIVSEVVPPTFQDGS